MRRRGPMLLLAVALLGAHSGAGEDAVPERSDRELLRDAFERTLHAPGVRSVELRVYRSGRLVSRRAFDVAYRHDAGGARSLLRFTAPNYLRGHALLVLETPEGMSDTWLYQAEERRPRRVGTAHKADSFYGSDLSFEELEHQRFDHFELRRLPDATEAGVSCAVIEAVPQRDSQYGRLVAWIDPVAHGCRARRLLPRQQRRAQQAPARRARRRRRGGGIPARPAHAHRADRTRRVDGSRDVAHGDRPVDLGGRVLGIAAGARG